MLDFVVCFNGEGKRGKTYLEGVVGYVLALCPGGPVEQHAPHGDAVLGCLLDAKDGGGSGADDIFVVLWWD